MAVHATAAVLAAAQQTSTAAPAGFVFDKTFAVQPPGNDYWEPPPGGLIRDGVYVARIGTAAVRITLTMATEFTGAFLEPDRWQEQSFLQSYHEQLLQAQLLDLQQSNINRRSVFSAVEADRRFALPAMRRTVVLEEVRSSGEPGNRLFRHLSWRFPHPGSPLLEFVVNITAVASREATIPTIDAEQLGFLNSLEALVLDKRPDLSIALPGARPDAMAIGHGALWVTDAVTNRLLRVDTVSRRVTATLEVGAGPHAIEVTRDAVWVANHNDDTLLRIDPLSARITASADVATGPHQILDHASGLWLVADTSCQVTRIDPRSGQPQAGALELGSVKRSLSGRREKLWRILGQKVTPCTDLSVTLAADGDALYAFERFKGTLSRLDAAAEQRPLKTGVEIGGFLVSGNDLWGVDDLQPPAMVYRIDIGKRKVAAKIEAGRATGTPLLAGGLVWVLQQRENSVLRIDPSTDRVVGSPIPVGSPAAMVADRGGIWVGGENAIVHVPF
jgi:hypothetical protein